MLYIIIPVLSRTMMKRKMWEQKKKKRKKKNRSGSREDVLVDAHISLRERLWVQSQS